MMDNIQYISRDEQVAITLHDPLGYDSADMRIDFWNQPGIANVVTKKKHLRSLRDLIDRVMLEEGLS